MELYNFFILKLTFVLHWNLEFELGFFENLIEFNYSEIACLYIFDRYNLKGNL
jgi:hypothetical protein